MTTKTVKIRLSWQDAEAVLRAREPSLYSLNEGVLGKLQSSIKKTFPEAIALIEEQEKAWDIVKEPIVVTEPENVRIAEIDAKISELNSERNQLHVSYAELQRQEQQRKFDEAGITSFGPTGSYNSMQWSPKHPESEDNPDSPAAKRRAKIIAKREANGGTQSMTTTPFRSTHRTPIDLSIGCRKGVL